MRGKNIDGTTKAPPMGNFFGLHISNYFKYDIKF
jgi:hypothetical protein